MKGVELRPPTSNKDAPQQETAKKNLHPHSTFLYPFRVWNDRLSFLVRQLQEGAGWTAAGKTYTADIPIPTNGHSYLFLWQITPPPRRNRVCSFIVCPRNTVPSAEPLESCLFRFVDLTHPPSPHTQTHTQEEKIHEIHIKFSN